MGSHNVNLPSKLSPPVNPFWPSSGSSEGSNHGQNGGMGSLAWKEREQRSCGGSSGGSAAAVASGMAWAYVVLPAFRLERSSSRFHAKIFV